MSDEPMVMPQPPNDWLDGPCRLCDGDGRLKWYVDHGVLSMWTGKRVVYVERAGECPCQQDAGGEA